MEKLPYWQKQGDKPLFADLLWNIPEQKSGRVNIIGGNSQSFSAVSRVFEYLNANFPLQTLKAILPDVLRTKLPPLPGFEFTPSTDSGSFARSPFLNELFQDTDFNLIIGDLTKNSATAIAITEAIKSTDAPVLLTRDAVDLIASEAEPAISRDNTFIVASMLQFQKLFRAVYYPKVLLLSMPLLPVVEALHKFTLSYPLTILTFHSGQIIVAKAGQIVTIPIISTPYSPLSLWSGTLACNIVALNLYNSAKPLEATVAAISKN